MPISENDIDLIDNYLKGNCSDAEKKQFEDRIKSDEAFNEEYLQLKSLSTAFEQLELKDELKQLESKIRGAAASRSFSNTKWISIAAGIAVIIGAVFMFNHFNNDSDINPNKMKYGTPLEVPIPKDSSAIDDSIPVHIKNILNYSEPVDNPAVYVDFSDGITNYSLNNDNNKEVFKMLFKVFAVEKTAEYFELHSDKLIPYTGSSLMSHFSEDGHKDENGKFLMCAPIDKAINAIVERDNVGVLITDGELYDEKTGKVSQETWASKAFEKWMDKGNELAIVYTDFDEQNDGLTYDKHMYVMFFIPSGENRILNNYLEELESEGLKLEILRFSVVENRKQVDFELIKDALTWVRIDGRTDDALYRSIKNIMKKKDVRPLHQRRDTLIWREGY